MRLALVLVSVLGLVGCADNKTPQCEKVVEKVLAAQTPEQQAAILGAVGGDRKKLVKECHDTYTKADIDCVMAADGGAAITACIVKMMDNAK